MMRWTVPTTGIAMCKIAVAVEEWLESARGYELPLLISLSKKAQVALPR